MAAPKKTKPPAETKTYPVLAQLSFDDEKYGPGTELDTVEMTEAEAKPLIALKVLGPAIETAPSA